MLLTLFKKYLNRVSLEDQHDYLLVEATVKVLKEHTQVAATLMRQKL